MYAVETPYCVETISYVVKLLTPPGRAIVLVFESKIRYKIPRVTPQQVHQILGYEQLAFIDRNRHLPQKRYKIGI